MNNNKVTQVTYQDPNKNMQKGFIMDGRTYKDPYGNERIETGSIVHTAGGDFKLTEAGGVKLPGSVANDIRNAYQKSAAHLGNAYKAQQNAINTATRRSQAQINDQRENANAQYRDANRTAYQAYVNASNPYGAAEEQRAKLGLANSGYSESSKMRAANTYQQALSQNNLARNAYMRELDNAYRDAQYNGDIELARALENYQQLVYKNGIDAAEAIASQENIAYNAGIAEDNTRWERELAAQEAARRRELDEREYRQRLWENAYKMAAAGFSDENIAKTLGVSLDELYRVVRGW